MNKIKLENLMLEPFRDLFNFKYWNVLSGGKGAGKSYQVAIFNVLKLLMDPHRCIIYASKHIKTNSDTTYPGVIKAIKVLDQYIPGLYQSFKFNSTRLIITHIPTNQHFKFVSFEKSETTSSISTDDPKMYYDTINFEELILSNSTFKGTDIKVTEHEIQTMINSTIRFDENNPYHAGAKPQVIFSNNPWNNQYWLIKDHLDKYLPNSMSEPSLRKKGSIKYVDNENGGRFISRTNVLCNPHASPIARQQLRDAKDWKNDTTVNMLTGLTYNLGEDFLKGVIHNLKHDIPKHSWPFDKKIKILGIGVDVGYTGDATTMYITASSLGHNGLPDFKNIYVLDEFYHDNRKDSKSDLRSAANIIVKAWELSQEYPEISHHGVVCNVDASAKSFIDTLKRQQRILEERGVHTSTWLRFRANKEKWLKENRVGNRYILLRQLIAQGRLHISPRCKQLLIDLPGLPPNPTKNTKRRHHDDTIDGMFYSFLPYMKIIARVNAILIGK